MIIGHSDEDANLEMVLEASLRETEQKRAEIVSHVEVMDVEANITYVLGV